MLLCDPRDSQTRVKTPHIFVSSNRDKSSSSFDWIRSSLSRETRCWYLGCYRYAPQTLITRQQPCLSEYTAPES